MRLARRSASTRCASRCGRPAPRRSATRCASRCTRPASGSVLHGVQAGEVHEDDQGLLRPLGNPVSAPCCEPACGACNPCETCGPCAPCCPRPSAACGCPRFRAGDRVHQVRARDLRKESSVHRLPDGARATREDLHLPGCHMVKELCEKQIPYTVCQHGARAAREDLHLSGLHMVPEQRVTHLHRSATWCPSNA